MNEPISESLRTIERMGVEAFGGTTLASDVGPTVRRVGRRRAGRVLGAGVVAAALVAATALGAVGYAARTVAPAGPSETPGVTSDAQRVLVTVKPGEAAADIAETLAAAAVIGSAQDFVNEAKENPADAARIALGQYWLPTGISASDALAAMLDPSKRQNPNITIQPGLTSEQIFRRLEETLGIRNADFYLAAKDPASFGLPAEANGEIEGWLGSFSYYFEPGATATEVLSGMVAATIFNLDEQGVAPSDRMRLLTEASLIERLMPFGDDDFAFARMIENRIAAGIPLQYDPGIEMRPDQDGNWTAVIDANGNSPHSAYVDPGLPPAPICSPSLASIFAAGHPADGPWLYFVPGGPGTGEARFAATLEEHKRDLAEFVAWEEARMRDQEAELRAEMEKLAGAMDAEGS